MKKVIAVLAVVLVVSGLGSMAYAQEPVNEVSASFDSRWIYDVSGDTFTNDLVTGRKEWIAEIHNPGVPISALGLTLNSTLEFDRLGRWEHLVSRNPPVYEWSFGNVPDGYGAHAFVGFNSPDVMPANFYPGFDASRFLSKTVFLQSEEPQDRKQILTIEVTPKQVTWISIGVCASGESDVVDAVITSPTSGEGLHFSPDGRWLNIDPDLHLNTPWSITIEIQVTPKVPKVEYMPQIHIAQLEHVRDGMASGASFPYEMPEIGIWNWFAQDSYVWQWQELHRRMVVWEPEPREIVEPTPQELMEDLITSLEDIVLDNPDTPLADKVEDALAKAQTALDELTKAPPDNQAAVGNIEGAVGDLEAAVSDGLLDPMQGTQLMDEFTRIARQLAVNALEAESAIS